MSAVSLRLIFSRLSDDDWVVHLDEETLLTENSVRGILNFVSDGRHDFGQGLVTYASSRLAFKSRLQAFQGRNGRLLQLNIPSCFCGRIFSHLGNKFDKGFSACLYSTESAPWQTVSAWRTTWGSCGASSRCSTSPSSALRVPTSSRGSARNDQ